MLLNQCLQSESTSAALIAIGEFGSVFAVRNSQAVGLVGRKADWRLRMCNAEWLTLTHRRGDAGRDNP
jgi:hypothetical protein